MRGIGTGVQVRAWERRKGDEVRATKVREPERGCQVVRSGLESR